MLRCLTQKIPLPAEGRTEEEGGQSKGRSSTVGGGQGATNGGGGLEGGGLERTRPEETVGIFEVRSHVLFSNNYSPVKGTRAL